MVLFRRAGKLHWNQAIAVHAPDHRPLRGIPAAVQEQVRDGRGLRLGATSTLDLEHLHEQGWQALLRWRKAAPERHSLFLGCSDSQESDSRAQWVRKKVDELAVGSEQL